MTFKRSSLRKLRCALTDDEAAKVKKRKREL